MGAGDRGAQAEPAHGRGQPGAQLAQLGGGLADRRVRVGGEFEREPVCLAARVLDEPVGQRAQHVLRAPGRRAVALEQHDLLFEAHRPRVEIRVRAPLSPLGQDRFHPHARQRARLSAVCSSSPRSRPAGQSSPRGTRAGQAVEAAWTRGTGSHPLIDRTFGALWLVDVHHRSSPMGAADSAWSRAIPCSMTTSSRSCRRKKPRVCFFPSASGDADHYVVRFYRHFSSEICDPSHISLFRRDCGPGRCASTCSNRT